jgi:hypothetical protein
MNVQLTVLAEIVKEMLAKGFHRFKPPSIEQLGAGGKAAVRSIHIDNLTGERRLLQVAVAV